MNVELIDSMGNDLSVVNAARVSFAKFKTEFDGGDERLIKYLATHNHFTPFTQVMYQVRITAPIFVSRQWFKHQIGISRNEVSRRYVTDVPEFWGIDDDIDIVWRAAPEKNKKQGSGDAVGQTTNTWINTLYRERMEQAKAEYDMLIDRGVCAEQARAFLPQGMYTQWIETGSLSAAARICGLRLDAHAQSETRDLASMFADAVSNIAPLSWKYLTQKD